MSLRFSWRIGFVFPGLPSRLLTRPGKLVGVIFVIFLFDCLLTYFAFHWSFRWVQFFRCGLLFRSLLRLLSRNDAEEVGKLVRFTTRWVNALVESVLMVKLLLLWILLLRPSAVVVRAEHHLELLRETHVVPFLQC